MTPDFSRRDLIPKPAGSGELGSGDMFPAAKKTAAVVRDILKSEYCLLEIRFEGLRRAIPSPESFLRLLPGDMEVQANFNHRTNVVRVVVPAPAETKTAHQFSKSLLETLPHDRQVDVELHSMREMLGLSTRGRQIPVERGLHDLTERILLLDNPVLARYIVARLNEVLLPALRRTGHPIGFSLPSGDDLLVLPLLKLHQNELKLRRKIEGLAISPQACALMLGANGAHQRFVKYDTEDILNLPLLVRPVFERLDQIMEIAANETCSMTRQVRREAQFLIHALFTTLESLHDYGGLTLVYSQDVRHRPVKPERREDKFKMYGIHEAAFESEMKRIGSLYLHYMQRAAEYFPRFFPESLPEPCTFRNGFYGHDELETVNRWNHTHPGRTVSLREIWVDGTRAPVREYRDRYNGYDPGKPGHVRHLRHLWKVWTRLQNFLGRRSEIATPPQMRKPLAEALESFYRATTFLLVQHRPEAKTLESLCNWIKKPAPRAPRRALWEYIRAGRKANAELMQLIVRSSKLEELPIPTVLKSDILSGWGTVQRYLGDLESVARAVPRQGPKQSKSSPEASDHTDPK